MNFLKLENLCNVHAMLLKKIKKNLDENWKEILKKNLKKISNDGLKIMKADDALA